MCTPQSIRRYLVPDLSAGSASRKQSPTPCRYMRTISSFAFGTSGFARPPPAGVARVRVLFFLTVLFFAMSVSPRIVGPHVRERERLLRPQPIAHLVGEAEARDRRRPLLGDLIAQERHVPGPPPLARDVLRDRVGDRGRFRIDDQRRAAAEPEREGLAIGSGNRGRAIARIGPQLELDALRQDDEQLDSRPAVRAEADRRPDGMHLE